MEEIFSSVTPYIFIEMHRKKTHLSRPQQPCFWHHFNRVIVEKFYNCIHFCNAENKTLNLVKMVHDLENLRNPL